MWVIRSAAEKERSREQRTSKNGKRRVGSSPATSPTTMRLVEVPTIVHVPPKMHAYDRGIIIFEGLIPVARHHFSITKGLSLDVNL